MVPDPSKMSLKHFLKFLSRGGKKKEAKIIEALAMENLGKNLGRKEVMKMTVDEVMNGARVIKKILEQKRVPNLFTPTMIQRLNPIELRAKELSAQGWTCLINESALNRYLEREEINGRHIPPGGKS